MEPEWSHGPRTNSLLFFERMLPIESADVGELGPLHDDSGSADDTLEAGRVENAETARSGMTSSGSWLCVIRARGTGAAAGTMGTGP